MTPANFESLLTPKASRIEPATNCIFFWSCVEYAATITKKLISRAIRSAKVTNQPWPPCAPPRFFLAISGGLFQQRLAVVVRQVGDQHLAHEGRALLVPDHQDAVDDQRARDVLLLELDVQLVG